MEIFSQPNIDFLALSPITLECLVFESVACAAAAALLPSVSPTARAICLALTSRCFSSDTSKKYTVFNSPWETTIFISPLTVDWHNWIIAVFLAEQRKIMCIFNSVFEHPPSHPKVLPKEKSSNSIQFSSIKACLASNGTTSGNVS